MTFLLVAFQLSDLWSSQKHREQRSQEATVNFVAMH